MDKFTKNDKANEETTTLADMPVGTSGKILKIIPHSRGEKKFADVGLVPGTELAIQSRAPFGGLIRVKVMQTSITIHSLDAKNILLEKDCAL